MYIYICVCQGPLGMICIYIIYYHTYIMWAKQGHKHFFFGGIFHLPFPYCWYFHDWEAMTGGCLEATPFPTGAAVRSLEGW